jgi:hypothetical protein
LCGRSFPRVDFAEADGPAGSALPQGFVHRWRSQNPRQRAEPRCFAGCAGHGFFWLDGRWVREVAEEVFRGGERACRSQTKENSVKHSEPVIEQPARPKRRSVLGRPRALTQAQIDTILAWHDSRVTLKQLAASLGVSTSTVVHAIQSRGGHYKQAPPEEREQTLKEHRAHCQALRDEHWL